MNFDLSTQKSQKFALWLILFGNVWPKKVQRSYLSWLESDAKFEEKLTFGLENNIKNLANVHQSTRASLKIGTLMGFFCPKLKIFELKIYRGVMCHENEEWCKNWRGIDFSVQNWHEQFDEFWFKHSKISKICTLMGCLWPKYIMLELKMYREVMFDSIEYW